MANNVFTSKNFPGVSIEKIGDFLFFRQPAIGKPCHSCFCIKNFDQIQIKYFSEDKAYCLVFYSGQRNYDFATIKKSPNSVQDLSNLIYDFLYWLEDVGK